MGERIKELRKALKMTQQEFADRLNVQRGSIASYETGRISPSNAAISLICKELNVSEDWLRNGEGDMFIPITRDEEIASFIGSVQADVDDTFKKRFISALAKLSTEEWRAIEHLMENMVSEREK
jgi:bacteriophage CI repressor helix-turn-helix domain